MNQFSRINATNVIIQNQTVGNHRFTVFSGSTITAKGIIIWRDTPPDNNYNQKRYLIFLIKY